MLRAPTLLNTIAVNTTPDVTHSLNLLYCSRKARLRFTLLPPDKKHELIIKGKGAQKQGKTGQNFAY
jgi:hypothetical protein